MRCGAQCQKGFTPHKIKLRILALLPNAVAWQRPHHDMTDVPKLLEDAAFAIETLRAMANPGIPLIDPQLLRHVAETLRRREIVIPE